MTDSKCTGSLASLTDGTLSLHSARYTRLRVFLIFLVLFSDARARARRTQPKKNCANFCRMSNAWSCLFERSASFDLNSTEKEVLQHVFSFEGIRARESTLSAHPPSPSICLSLSLSRSKGRRAKGQFNFFPQFKFGKLGEKRGKREPKGQSSERFFFLFWMNFGTMHFCCYVLNGGGDLQKI